MQKQAVPALTFILFYLLSICPNVSSAQVIAGSVPAGTSTQNPNLMLSDSVIGMTVSDSLDIDCDNINDIALDLYRGNTSVDQSNDLWYRLLNNSFEICTDTGGIHYTVPFYDAGDTLCSGVHLWRPDTIHRMACGGGFCWYGIHQATDKYLAYRKISTQQIGWIKISFNLWGVLTVTASVSEMLVLCTGNGAEDIFREPSFSITPNPSADGKVKLQCSKKIARIEIINALGQVVKTIQGSKTDITLPEEPGLYVVMITDDKGDRSAEKVWRQ